MITTCEIHLSTDNGGIFSISREVAVCIPINLSVNTELFAQ